MMQRKKKKRRREIQQRFPGVDKSLRAQMEMWVQKPVLDQSESLSYLKLHHALAQLTSDIFLAGIPIVLCPSDDAKSLMTLISNCS